MINKLYEKIKNYIKENYKFLIALVFILIFFLYELPFVIYKPGGIIDLENRIVLDDGYESTGSLNMSYASMIKGNIPFVLLSFIIPNWDLVSNKEITYEGEDVDDAIKRDRILLENGIDNAIFSAYKLANKEIKITKTNLEVIYIDKQAKTNLKIGDIILEVNGEKVLNLDDLQEYLSQFKEDNEINIKVLRDKKEVNCMAKVINLNGSLKMGVSIINHDEYELNPKIEIKTKASESGSSGGLMTALAIYNILVPEDITKGRKIVGTGTIDSNGNVGEIGGVKYKLLGAEKNKADIFLCPKENYEEAIQVKKDNNLNLDIIGVGTLNEALQSLK